MDRLIFRQCSRELKASAPDPPVYSAPRSHRLVVIGSKKNRRPRVAIRIAGIASPARMRCWIRRSTPLFIRVKPPLRPGHIFACIGWTRAGMPSGSTDFRFGHLRGIHTSRRLVGPIGAKLIESQTTSFMVRQTSLANPANPLNSVP